MAIGDHGLSRSTCHAIACIKHAVSTSVVNVVAAGPYTRWPRHRWFNFDVAADELCLLEGICETGSDAYPSFALGQRVEKGPPPPRDIAPLAVGDGPALPALADGAAGGLAPAAGGGAHIGHARAVEVSEHVDFCEAERLRNSGFVIKTLSLTYHVLVYYVHVS